MTTTPTPHFAVTPLQPGGYSQVDASALQAVSQNPGAPIIAVPGDCKGGQPNTALKFTNAGVLRNVLRSGPAYDTARAAFLGGATVVKVVRLGTPTQSSESMAGASGNPVTFKSSDYGAWTTGIKRTIAANNKVTFTFTDALGTTYNEVYSLGSSATAQQLVDAVNGKTPGFTKSQYITAVNNGTGTMPLSTSSIAALGTAGTDDGAVDAGDWTTGLVALETEDVDIIVPATGDATIMAQVLAHCDAMSATQARHERVLVAGGVLGENVATVTARMTSLRNKRVQLAYPGISIFNDAGTLTLYDPYVSAGFLAGMHAGLPDVATSLVFDNLGSQVVDVEFKLSSIPGGDLDQLLAASVTPIAADPSGGFRVIDSLSGYIADFTWHDFHKVRTADYVSQFVRESLERELVGMKAGPALLDLTKAKANGLLDQLVGRGILTGHNAADAVSDPNTSAITYVQLPVVLPDTNKFILLTVALQPVSSLTPAT